MLPSRKEAALSLDEKAFDEFCGVCKGEAQAVLAKQSFEADAPKKDDALDPKLAKQMDLKI